MRFLLAGQSEIDGILQGPSRRADIEIGGLVAIVILVEGEATARRIGSMQSYCVVRKVFLDKVTEHDIHRRVCQGTFQCHFRCLHRFDSKRNIPRQTSLPPTTIGTFSLALRATLCRKEIAGASATSDWSTGDIAIFTGGENHRLATGKAHVEILYIKARQGTGNNLDFRGIDYG